MGLKIFQTFSYADVNFGDVLATCVARVAVHDQTILYERPLEVAPHAPAIQADFRAPGDWLLDPDQQQKRFDLTRNRALLILQALHRKELEK